MPNKILQWSMLVFLAALFTERNWVSHLRHKSFPYRITGRLNQTKLLLKIVTHEGCWDQVVEKEEEEEEADKKHRLILLRIRKLTQRMQIN